MKRLNYFLVILALLISQAAFTQNTWISFDGADQQFPSVVVEEQDMSGITLNISIPGMYSEEVIHDGITYQRLSFEAWQTL
ncbi:MAG: hypothetical protein KAJ50_01590, partial [Bacteroidales bacterium]|nr:hypothetical protein [Bacteroidales bacterium]